MAANMKAVKLRMKSIRSTMQITKAMGLVASSKLRKAKTKADAIRNSFDTLRLTLKEIAAGNTDFSSEYTRDNGIEKDCYIVIAGDRGLAGGYNSNLFKSFEAETKGKNYCVIPIGKKTVEYFGRRNAEIVTENFSETAEISVSDCFEIAGLVCELFRKKQVGQVGIFYTRFRSLLSQIPENTPILPVSDLLGDGEYDKKKIKNQILYKPSAEEVYDAIVPEMAAAIIYGGVVESAASELAARRTAMDAATKNAGEMMDKLELYYNRARQAGITQEITEIVAGAEGT